jgi:hypothetical protein
MTTRTSAILLIGAFVVFLTGAGFWPVREFEQPLAILFASRMHVGWVGVAAGVAGLVGFPLLRGGPFAPPIIAHSYGMLVGIVLLIRS